MSGITTHVLDTSRGAPAAGLGVVLERREGGAWRAIATAVTDADGRCRDLAPGPLVPAVHRFSFATAPYFASRQVATFFPEVTVTFAVADVDQHYHVPVLLGPYGYTTYRGS